MFSIKHDDGTGFQELGFEVNDIPLMIEAIPVSPDCLILIITKVEDPEEMRIYGNLR